MYLLLAKHFKPSFNILRNPLNSRGERIGSTLGRAYEMGHGAIFAQQVLSIHRIIALFLAELITLFATVTT